MIDGGEDPLFIARRLVILASEDVGLADSRGLQVAVAAQQAVHFVGMPEGFFPLAHATLYLATAPKSNRSDARMAPRWKTSCETRNDPVPLHLRNAPTRLDARSSATARVSLRYPTTMTSRRSSITAARILPPGVEPNVATACKKRRSE